MKTKAGGGSASLMAGKGARRGAVESGCRRRELPTTEAARFGAKTAVRVEGLRRLGFRAEKLRRVL
ncbi:hypothetical protein HPP92_003332 [Vanilla planifolia]|uniref:Uncharacterized protein n=1 Tax=Vanilla planifolia TaxID=51239 RepID=A0A835VJB1_VANPL|nr:hypothetical protein HPP92_003332 [Vanilla planifolia]